MTDEKKVLELIATDRIYVPISSMAGKLQRARPKLGRELGLNPGESFDGKRAYARVFADDTMKARGMRNGVDEFAEKFPRYGKILNGMIEEQRAKSEVHVEFGMYDGCKLTEADYLGVMRDLGFSETQARNTYQPLMNASRKISKARDEERSVLIG